MIKPFSIGKKNDNNGKGLREINNASAALVDEAMIYAILGFVLLALVTFAFRVIIIF